MSFPRIEFFGMFQTGWLVIFALILTATDNLFAQTEGPSSLPGLVLSEISAFDTAPNLAVWRNLHPNEPLKNADYDNEYETQGLWCAASVAEFAFPGVKVTRQAFFYVPSGKPGDPLPGHQDASLLRQCRMLALWYEVENPRVQAILPKRFPQTSALHLGRPKSLPGSREQTEIGVRVTGALIRSGNTRIDALY